MKKENKLNQNVISRLTRGSSGMIFHNNKASKSTGFRIKSGMTQGLLALTLILGLAVTGPAQAECRGGTEVKGVKNDHTYCVSNITMTWWSAFTWCQANNRTLAEWD